VARAVPEGDRLCFRLVCRRWAAAGKAVVPGAGEEQLSPGKVTRTSLLDMAASMARVKMTMGVLKGSPILVKCPDDKVTSETFAEMLCPLSAEGGHLAVLTWARAHGYLWNEITRTAAAKNQHLEVLQWARANGCPWDKWACVFAAENGHLEVLQYARASGRPWDKIACAAPAQNGHFEIFQKTRANNSLWDKQKCAIPQKREYFKVLHMAVANNRPGFENWGFKLIEL